MAYPKVNSDNYVNDMLSRKELFQYKSEDMDKPDALKIFSPTSYQLFDANYMSPETHVKRLLLKYDTGTGKTIAAILIALRFINDYKKIYMLKRQKMSSTGSVNIYELDKTTPSVYIIGYSATKTAFIRDLLKHVEFGMITETEKQELHRLEHIARSSLPDDIKRAYDYKRKLKKNLTNKARGGYFKFMGYKKLVNKLFTSNTVDLTELEYMVKQDHKATHTLEDLIYKYVNDGTIQVNTGLLEQFKDSLIICDEVHNIYNMNMKNNFGVAIQYILNHHSSLRGLFLTATPINNTPTEIVDLLDFLLDKKDHIKKSDIFHGKKLLPGALNKIGTLIKGKVSFIQDINPKYFPERIFIGESIKFTQVVQGHNSIPYLKFIRCPMSELHKKTLTNLIEEGYKYSKLSTEVIKNIDDDSAEGGTNLSITQNTTANDTADYSADYSANDTAGHTANHTADYSASGSADYSANDSANHTANYSANHTANDTADYSADYSASDSASHTANGSANDTADYSADYSANHIANGSADYSASDSADYSASHTANGTANDTADYSASHTASHTANDTADYSANGSASDSASHTASDSASHTASDSASHTANGSASDTADYTANHTANDTANDTADYTANHTADYSASGSESDSENGKISQNMEDINYVEGGVKTSIEQIMGVKIPPDGSTIYDMVFPNPLNPSMGMYRSSDVRGNLASSTQKQRDLLGIDMIKRPDIYITGNFLSIKNINKYSGKYYKLINIIIDILNSQTSQWRKNKLGRSIVEYGQKIMIYHRRVGMSGVKLIQEILSYNGIIDETSNPTNNTLCSVCGGIMHNHTAYLKHNNIQHHDFTPTRFIVVHADIDERVWLNSMEKFNSMDNVYGNNLKIFIGSKKIEEGFDIRAVQHLLIASMPVNISALIQVLGRCIRKGSHDALPPDRRKVHVNILVSSWDNKNPTNHLTPDEYRYFDKLLDYIVIQHIEKVINMNAIDANIHRNRIMPPDLYKQYFPKGQQGPINSLGNLYFEPSDKIKIYNPNQLDLRTFNAYGHFESEINDILYIIKRLFLIAPVWTYDNLWKYVKSPPFPMEVNTLLFEEGNFVIALNKILTVNNLFDKEEQHNIMSMLRNPNEKFLYKNGAKHMVIHVDKYYILMPVKPTDNPSDTPTVVYDIESYMKPPIISTGISIPLNSLSDTTRDLYNYNIKKESIKEKIKKGIDFTTLLLEYDHSFMQMLLAESISQNLIAELDGKINKSMMDTYDKILGFFDDFRSIIYAEDIIKYKSTVALFTNKNIISNKLHIDKSTPIGYLTKHSIKLYDHPRWIDVSKPSMNIRTHFVEPGPITGYIDVVGDTLKFKVRNALTEKSIHSDTRLIEKGIVCESKSRHDIINMAESLKIKIHPNDKNRDICMKIYKNLVDKEIAERVKDTKYKYFYMFYEELPDF
jgi:hypothetical protein